MARINIVNADNKIDATPQRAYFKLKQTGGPKGEKGDTGAQGPQGATGPQGASASVVVNSTTTLPAGSDATVENIGTPQNVKLNFGIPTGPQGPQGEQGPQGAQGPQGLKGDTGAKGADGAAAKVTVGNTNTGAAGTNAIVENTGSETFAVLNFTIPRGDKGETGPMPDIAQTTGQATDEVMSQKATTDALATKQNTLTAGTGITIASDTVSADTTVLATKADLNDYAPQATTYTKTETDALLAPKLETDVVTSLPATGEEGKLYLTPKDYTRQTATGNPIEATISDGAGTLESFQLDGDTEQQTYTGKNLVRPVGTTGVVATYNKATGEYSVSRATAASWPWLTGYCELPQTITSGTTITISRNVGSSFNFWVRTYHPDNTYGSYNFGTSTLSQVITEEKDIDRIVIMANSVPDNFSYSFKLQVEIGNQATSFEPYVGGVPSPNPDYPQQIQTVTGEQTVKVVGKNLANVSAFELGNISSTGGIYDDRYFHSPLIPVIAGSGYTATATFASGTSDKYIRIAFYAADGSFISRPSLQSPHTATAPGSAAFCRIALVETATDVMLELGSTATTYAPYHATSCPINLGKNLFDNMGWEQGQYADGVWSSGNTKRATSGFIPITGGTYTMSLNSTDNKTAFINLNYFDGAKTWLGNRATLGLAQFGDTDRVKTFTLPNNARYLRVTVRPYGGDDQGDNVVQYAPSEELQVEAGSTNTSYAAYFTPIELCKLGAYQDYIWKDGDDWKVHKATGAVTLTGAEYWQYKNVGTSATFFQLQNSRWDEAFGANTHPIGDESGVVQPTAAFACDGLTSIEASDNNMKINQGCGKKGVWFRIALLNTWNVSTTEQFQTWLSTHNMKLKYALATATDTTITNATLIAQLEAIRTAALETGTNTIANSTAGANLAGDMEITYYGYNPTNRYDKFIWLDLNNNYEQIGE